MRKPMALSRSDGPGMVKGVAIAALAVGIGVWGALLLAPAPQKMPPALDLATPSGQDTSAVAAWFGGNALRVPIVVQGLIRADDGRGSALLSVNGGTVQAYRIGQALAPGVILSGVSANGVSIDQDGVIEQIAMPANPANLVQGFIPVTAGSASATRP